MCGRGRGGEQPEEEQRAHRLRGFRRRETDQREESDPQRTHGDPTGGRDSLVEAGEQQRPRDQEHADQDHHADQGRGGCRTGGQTEDGAEQDAHPRRSVGAAAVRRVDRQEQHAQTEHPREHAADHDVVGSPGSAEHAHPHGHGDRRPEQPDPQVDPCREGRERTGEGDVAEGVSGEYLRPEDDEIADGAAPGRDAGSRQERVPHERMTDDRRYPPEDGQRRGHVSASRIGAGPVPVRAPSVRIPRAAT